MPEITYADAVQALTVPGGRPATEESTWAFGTNPWGVVDWYAADLEKREARQHIGGKAVRLEAEHHGVYAAAFSDLTREGLKRGVRDILESLAGGFGLAWVDLAKMVGVSVPAIRKWRLDGGVNPENHRRIAEVWAFLSVLEKHAHVADPAGWIAQRMIDGHTVTVRHLYSPTNVGRLLDYATSATGAADVLDKVEPGWREEYATADEVVPFDDGGLAIVGRR